MFPPQRIVCLTEETVETLYLLGEDERIVGVSGFVVRPPEARRDKPRVSTFTDAKVDEIVDLNPDLIFTFSDIQAEITANLMKAGLEVHAFNHRTVHGIFDMIRTVGALISEPTKAAGLTVKLQGNIDQARQIAGDFKKRPRVFFEEWDDPIISGIGWVSELIEIAGGEDVFAELGRQQAATDRIVSAQQVIEAAPDIIIGSWCGKMFKLDEVRQRPGFADIPAVKNGHLYEVKSPIILQPGPAALSDGLFALQDIIRKYNEG